MTNQITKTKINSMGRQWPTTCAYNRGIPLMMNCPCLIRYLIYLTNDSILGAKMAKNEPMTNNSKINNDRILADGNTSMI